MSQNLSDRFVQGGIIPPNRPAKQDEHAVITVSVDSAENGFIVRTNDNSSPFAMPEIYVAKDRDDLAVLLRDRMEAEAVKMINKVAGDTQ
jgi:hypothetical protein